MSLTGHVQNGVVVFDEPHPAYYGGTVAAPVFQEVIADSLKYLSTLEQGDNE